MEKTHTKAKVSRGVQFSNLGLLPCISSILKQKLEFLNRTQTSLNLAFLLSDST